jgi:ABC-2 type transport system ATP-binding protein
VLKVDIANLTPKLLTKIESMKCVKSVSQENATHVKVHATGDKAFDTIIDALRAENAKINSVEHVQPTLEDVFLQITGRDMRDKADNKIPAPQHGPFRAQQRIR